MRTFHVPRDVSVLNIGFDSSIYYVFGYSRETVLDQDLDRSGMMFF